MKRDFFSSPVEWLAVALVFFAFLLLPLLMMQAALPLTGREIVSQSLMPEVIADDLGKPVIIDKIPQRIISLSPSTTEILFALGLGDKVVGVTEFCNYPVEAGRIEKVGGYSTTDIEKIITLQPDLILAGSIHVQEVIPALEEKGFTVFTLAPKNLDGILQDIRVVGEITGKGKEASEFVTQMQSRIVAVTDKTGKSEKLKVFYVNWHDPLWSVGSGTIINELIEKAGGVNIFRDITGHRVVDLETVIVRDPGVIIACTGHGAAEDEPFEWAKEEPTLAVTKARRNNRIYQIDADLVSRDGPRIVEALEQLACFIHPEIFDTMGSN